MKNRFLFGFVALVTALSPALTRAQFQLQALPTIESNAPAVETQLNVIEAVPFESPELNVIEAPSQESPNPGSEVLAIPSDDDEDSNPGFQGGGDKVAGDSFNENLSEISINRVNYYLKGGGGVLYPKDPPANWKSAVFLNGDLFYVEGDCSPQETVVLEGNFKNSPAQVACDQNGAWIAEKLEWTNSFQQGPWDEVLTVQHKNKLPEASETISLDNGGSGVDGCVGIGDDNPYNLPICNNEGMGHGGACFNAQEEEIDCPTGEMTIEVPNDGASLKKGDPFKVEGTCDANQHIFVSVNATTNPAYALCSPQGTYETANLTWLDSVQKGGQQAIEAKQIDSFNEEAGDDSIVVYIVQEFVLNLNECNDTLDNDSDGGADEDDAGCHTDFDVNNPDSYDPTDDDEGDEPQCSDGIDNDNDGLEDMDDPDCDSPSDDNEKDEPVTECNDGIDNDNDGLIDKEDPDCQDDEGDYDPTDDDEDDEDDNDDNDDDELPQCSDGVDNDDDDDLIDADDPGCYDDNDIYNPEDDDEGDDESDPEVKPECSDGIDNDNDGLIDELDPHCTDDNDDSEAPDGLPQCSDGVDNDSDGRVDAQDPACHTDGDIQNPNSYDPDDDDEGDEKSCADIKDNDGDELADEKDPGCHTDYDPTDGDDSYDPTDDNEGDEPVTECNDGIDNDNDNKIDKEDPDCLDDEGEYNPGDDDEDDEDDKDDNDDDEPAQCEDGIDNDNDGLIDEKDPDCYDDEGDYNPDDDDEDDEKSDPDPDQKPACKDNVDNDNDGDVDEDDPGCHTDGDKDNPDSYDPNDDNEKNPACSDGVDNDNDGKVDGNDPGCWDDPNDPGTYDPGDNNENGDQSDEGSIVFDPDRDYVAEANRICLGINPNRALIFTDVDNLNQEGALAALVLKSVFLRVDENFIQYVLGGVGSDLLNTGEIEIQLDKPLTRYAGAKLLLGLHCLPVLDEDFIPNNRYDGSAMITYVDLPRSGAADSTFEQDLAYSIQYFGTAMRGNNEGEFEGGRAFKNGELYKPVVRLYEFIKDESTPTDYSGLPNVVLNHWSAELYAQLQYEDEDLLDHLPGSLTDPDGVVLRRDAFDLMVNAIKGRELFDDDDQELLEDLIDGN